MPSPLTIDFLMLSRSFIRAITLRSEGVMPIFSRKRSISFLVPEPFFTDDDRIFQKLFEIDRIFLEFQVVFCDRRGDHEGILTEGNKDTALISGILPDKCKIDSSVQNAVASLPHCLSEWNENKYPGACLQNLRAVPATDKRKESWRLQGRSCASASL